MTIAEMSGARFSKDRIYRHLLWRRWDVDLPWLNLIGCNPSKAGAVESDPTVTRQIERAKRLRCGGLLVTNANDLVATDPRDMKRHARPTSPENDTAIMDAAETALVSGGIILVAWGRNMSAERAERVLFLLGDAPLKCLGVNADGSPQHPLYKAYDTPLRDYP